MLRQPGRFFALFASEQPTSPSSEGKKKQGKSKKQEDEAPQGIEEIRQVRVDKLDLIRSNGFNPFEYTFNCSHKTSQLQNLCLHLKDGEEDPSFEASVAGRIMTRRVFGKLAFFTLQDDAGTIQLYLEKGRLQESFDKVKEWTDAGDIIGVKGTMKRTEKGELSVFVSEWQMLTKALLPLPDKFKGLTDVNKRYRQRHLDMIVNPEVRERFRSRAFITSTLRRLLDADGFLEIETPILNSQPGGAEAKPFETYHNTLAMPLTLRIATELHLKRLIVGGFDRVYEIGRIFRNEGLSTRHNPEFTSIELYQAYADYHDMMSLTERLVSTIAKELTGSTVVPYQGEQIDLTPPWRRITMHELVKEKSGVDFLPFILSGDAAGAREAAQGLGLKGADGASRTAGEILNLAFEEVTALSVSLSDSDSVSLSQSLPLSLCVCVAVCVCLSACPCLQSRFLAPILTHPSPMSSCARRH